MLCRQLLDVKKGSLSMFEYLAQIKNLIEALALVEKIVRDNEIVLVMLDGLGIDYERFVTSIFTEINRSLNHYHSQCYKVCSMIKNANSNNWLNHCLLCHSTLRHNLPRIQWHRKMESGDVFC